MLVLSRKVGQSLLIGDNIEVIVTKFHDGRVSLGIKAPREISVRRNELKNIEMKVYDEISPPMGLQVIEEKPNEGTQDVDQRTTTNSR